jgi:class 3 adenylate cyclase
MPYPQPTSPHSRALTQTLTCGVRVLTVQLAPRICGYADGGQIFTSNVIRELRIGKGFSFIDRGAMPLKGFDEPVSIFEVAWQLT